MITSKISSTIPGNFHFDRGFCVYQLCAEGKERVRNMPLPIDATPKKTGDPKKPLKVSVPPALIELDSALTARAHGKFAVPNRMPYFRSYLLAGLGL